MQDNKLIALIGCGTWGQNILRTLVDLKANVTVVEKSDVHKQQALDSGALNYLLYDNNLIDHIPNNTDGIIVATPSATHRDVIEQVIDLRIPLFIEKPLTTNLEDAQKIAASTHNNIFMMHIWQYHPGIRMLANIATNKELGELLQIKTTRANWTSPRLDTDTLWNFMCHDLSIFNSILGQLPNPEYACAEKHQGIIRDMTATFGDSPLCITHISNRFERKMREVRLHCSNGVAVLQNEQVDYIEIIHGDDASFEPKIEQRPFGRKTALEYELEAFVSYLNGGDPPLSDLQDGLNMIAMIDKLNQMI